MKTLILIRHGQAEHNQKNKIAGWENTVLTDFGREQAKILAKRIEREFTDITKIISSDLSRALETARILNAKIGVDILITSELRERNFGIANGMNKTEAQKYIKNPTDPLEKWIKYPNSETWDKFYLRVSTFLEKVIDELEDTVIIVCHGGTIRNIISWWLGIGTPIGKVHFPTDLASLTVLRKDDRGEKILHRLNDVSHFNV